MNIKYEVKNKQYSMAIAKAIVLHMLCTKIFSGTYAEKM